MAEDRLIFGIGFDLDTAVKDAEKDFGKVIKELQSVAENKPLQLKVETDLKSIKAAEGSISKLRDEMARLSKQWESIPNISKFDASGKLTAEAKELADQYMTAADSLSKYGMTLEQITRARKQAAIDEQKAEEKRYNEWLRNKSQEAAETERIERQKQAATARTIAEQNKEYERQAAAEQKRQAAISASLKSEYQKIALKQQAEAASRRELEMLNERLRKEAQIAAATKNQQVQAAYNARRKAGLALQKTLQAEENSIAAINAKLQIQSQRLKEVDTNSAKFNKIAKEVERLSKKLEEANNRVAQLTGQTVRGQQRITSAVQDTNRAYSSTEGYITRLIKRSAVLFGIHQVSRFAQKLRETTAEFELQRVSLGAIIQDTEKANALFNQIKTFAVQSPFEIKDLVGYVKQLSAYRIETDKLFDTTKRLADVSAGLGVDMGRLILAYGQVKAASVLRGQEVRQFTEAGIPLIQLLADKFTALRGEMVSTAEVFDLISQRAVSFEMVAEIFDDMTNAGGMFYNMQEKQAQTLAGQWSNLKDALSIMYDEMGNTKGAHAAMENMISLTKTLAQNWQLVGGLIMQTLGGAAILGVVNKIKSLWNMLGVQMYSATEKVAIAQDRYNAAVARQNALLPTATNLERAAAAQKVKTAAAALKSAKAIEATALSSNKFTFALKRLGAVIKANPLGFLISVALTLYQVISHLVSKSNELKNALADIGAEGAKNITVMTRNFELLANKAVQAADGSKAQKDALDELQRTYKDMIPTHLLTIENLRNMAGSYDILTTAIQEYCRQQMLANQIETIVGNTTEKISKAQTKLRKKLKDTNEMINVYDESGEATGEVIHLSFDERTIERAFAGIEKYARTTADSVQDIIRNAFKDFAGVELTDKEVQAISELGGFANNMYTLVAAYREQETEIKRVTEQQKALTGEVGLYGDLIDAATEKINNFSDEALKVGTYEFDTAKAKAAADEYVSVIKRIFQDSGLTFEDAWVDGKFIDIDSINKALVDAGNKVSSQAHKAFGKIATAYYELVPSDVFSKAINKKFEDVAGGMNVNMDLIKKYLKDSDTSIDDFVKNFFSSIDELEKKIQQTRALLQAPNLSESERGKKSADLANYEQELEVLKALIPFIQLFNVEKSKSGSGTDDRLSKLKEEVSLLEKIYNNYKKYTEYESKSDAQARINREFGKTLRIFEKYGIALPTTAKEFQTALQKLQGAMQGLPKSEKDIMELGFKIEQVNFDESKKNLESELKRLADEVSRTKTAKEFFDKMLNMTGDQQLSANITMSVYGDTGKGLFEKMKDNIVKSFSGFDISLAVDMVNEVIDYNQLEKLYKIYEKDIPEARRKGIEQMIADGKKENAENVKMWVEQLAKAKDFEQQRTDIIRAETERRNKIIKSDQEQSVKDTLLKQSFDLQGQELSKINVDEFKASEDYIKIFEDLDKVSSATIDRLIERLEALIDENRKLGGEGTEGMKTLIQALDKLKDTKIQRGDPLEGAVSSIREYIAAKREQKIAKEELAAERTAYANQEAQLNLNIINAQQEELQAQEAVNAAKAEYLALAQQLAELEATEGADPEQVAAMQQQVFAARQRLTTAELQQNAAVTKTVKAEEAKAKAAEKVRKAEQKVTNAQDKQRTASNKFTQSISKAAEVADAMRNVIQGISDTLGVAADTDLGMAFEAGVTALQQFSSLMNTIIALQTLYNIVTESNPWIAIAAAVLTVASILGNVISNAKVKRANKEIERQQNILDALEHSYERLQKASEQLFSSEYVANYNKQLENLYAQISAKQKQLEAEKSKGSKKDKDKIEDYENDIQGLYDSIEDMQHQLSEQFLGTDIASAARSFTQSWLDAYKEFGDTRKAIEGEMEDMMQNLIQEAVFGAVMQNALKDLYKFIDESDPSDMQSERYWKTVNELYHQAIDTMNTGASVAAEWMEDLGMLTRNLGSEMTGISKDIASASEESILGLASLMNTELFYISYVPQIHSEVVAIKTLLQGGSLPVSDNVDVVDLITIQNQHLAYLPNIALNTAQTAERCERAAQACESIAENLNRVIKPNGVQGTHRVVTSLQS